MWNYKDMVEDNLENISIYTLSRIIHILLPDAFLKIPIRSKGKMKERSAGGVGGRSVREEDRGGGAGVAGRENIFPSAVHNTTA